MKVYSAATIEATDTAVGEIADALAGGGIACLPCGGTYRLLCDVGDTGAVMRLMHVKRRTGHSPSLVFVADQAGLDAVAADVSAPARALADALWPAPLTLLVKPSDALPGKVVKQLTRANKRLGVRVPASPLMRAVVAAFGGPVLASSANRENKAGAHSGAVVRQSFGGRIDIFVDAGELDNGSPSTVIDAATERVVVRRPGSIDAAELDALLTGAGFEATEST